MKPKKKFPTKIIIFILFSLQFHLLLFFALHQIDLHFQKNNLAKTENEKENLKVLWLKNNSMPEVADIEKPAKEEIPKAARFASQYNSKVKNEQVAKAKPKPKQISENPYSSSQNHQSQISPKASSEKKASSSPQTPQNHASQDPISHKNLSLKPSDLNLKPSEEQKPKKNSEQNISLKTVGSGLSYSLSAKPDQFLHDYYPDYKVGDKTYLNALKFQDAAYIAKMKRILKLRWNPSPSIENYLLRNQISSGKIQAVIGMSVDAKGKLLKVFVIKSAGIASYDQEALNTIRESSPFSSPPENFIKEGEMNLAWTFVVYL